MEKYPPTIYNKFPKELFVAENLSEYVPARDTIISIGGFANKKHIALELKSGAQYPTDHELLHFFDRHKELDNHKWAKNAHGENYENIYGQSGQEAIINGTNNSSRPNGFIRAYGKFGGIEEDQATIAGYLMKNLNHLEDEIKNEPALQKKIEMMKEYYFEISDGLMDEKYWIDLKNGVEMDEKYWELKRNNTNKSTVAISRTISWDKAVKINGKRSS